MMIVCIQGHVAAQSTARLFPAGDHLPRLLAAPREPVTGAKFVWNDDSPNEYGSGFDGEVAFGVSIPLYLISGRTVQHGLTVGVGAGVFGRFTLENNARELITTDWVVALPFTLRRGDNWYQFRYHHYSGHLGDEYSSRFSVEAENIGRDAVEITAFRQAAPELGFYGGFSWSYIVHPDSAQRFVTRVGAQVEPRSRGGALVPYGAVDVQWEQDNDWEPRMNLQIGVRLPEFKGRRMMRIAMEFFAGPSAQGQFHEEHVRHLTLGIYIDP
jgi:hypothetical protein